MVGDVDGLVDGAGVGDVVGPTVGWLDGIGVEGAGVGSKLGAGVGYGVGCGVGPGVEPGVGSGNGAIVGTSVGCGVVGAKVGTPVGVIRMNVGVCVVKPKSSLRPTRPSRTREEPALTGYPGYPSLIASFFWTLGPPSSRRPCVVAKASARMVAATLRMVACACAVVLLFARREGARYASVCRRAPPPPRAPSRCAPAGLKRSARPPGVL